MTSEELQHLADLENADYLREQDVEDAFLAGFYVGRNGAMYVTPEEAWRNYNA